MPSRERPADRGAALARETVARVAAEAREARLAIGLGQADVARALGISVAQVSRIERGLSPDLSIAMAARLGAVLGLRAHHGRSHVARATVEGACIQLAVVAQRLDGLAPIREVRATGGALTHPLWRRTLAAALGRPMTLVDAVEGTALGAAAVALATIGRSPSPEDAARDLLIRLADDEDGNGGVAFAARTMDAQRMFDYGCTSFALAGGPAQ